MTSSAEGSIFDVPKHKHYFMDRRWVAERFDRLDNDRERFLRRKLDPSGDLFGSYMGAGIDPIVSRGCWAAASEWQRKKKSGELQMSSRLFAHNRDAEAIERAMRFR